jgi:lysophospholipase L1-like esterase
MPNHKVENLVAYIALGDSISIDLYPARDLNESNPDEPLGAAALLYKNHDRVWPDWKGRDLHTLNPKIQFANLCEDGATTWHLLAPAALGPVEKYKSDPVLITITIGGNDLLGVARQNAADVMSPVADTVDRIETIIKNVLEKFTHATVILNSVYDPTDGTGNMPYMPNLSDKLPFLRYINLEIEKIATKHGAIFGDIYSTFQGHGHGKPDSYYWEPSPIEPSARGASALRELWWRTLENAHIISAS